MAAATEAGASAASTRGALKARSPVAALATQRTSTTNTNCAKYKAQSTARRTCIYLQTAHGLGKGGQADRQSRRHGIRRRRRRRMVLEINHVENSDVPPHGAHLHDDRFAEPPVMVHLRVICDVTCRTKYSGENSLGLRHDCTHLYPEHY